MTSPSTARTMGPFPGSTVILSVSLRWVIPEVATVPVSTAQSSRSRANGSSAVIIRRSRTPSARTGRTSGAWSRG